jgi:ankyrin repeat protein
MNSRDSDGQTVLHQVTISGDLGAVKWLHERGADITVADNDGMTVLHCAAESAHLDILQWLTATGADFTE